MKAACSPRFGLVLGAVLSSFLAGAALAQTPQTTTAPNPFGQTSTPAAPSKKAKKQRAAPVLKAGQFASEGEAKASCPGDAVVWANIGTKVYHHAGASTYGKTKRGAYMCEKQATASGIRAAKNEK